MAFDDVCEGIYVTTRFLSFINCRINQGRTGNLEEGFSNGLFLLQQYFNTDSQICIVSSHKEQGKNFVS